MSAASLRFLRPVKSLALVAFTFTAVDAHGQLVYIADKKSEAQKVVFETRYKVEATHFIYITNDKGEARTKEGCWYYVSRKKKADLSVYFTTYKSEADWIVYYTKKKVEAGKKL